MEIQPRKRTLWGIKRTAVLMGYVLYGFTLTMGTIYYLVISNITIPRPWGMLLIGLIFLGPWVPPLMWINAKKKKVAKELEKQQTTEAP